MKSNKTNKQYPVAWPLALCYGFAVRLRNLCFGLGILPSETYPIAVISVGNLSAGGAGKTPLVEYLVRLLSPRYRVAVLSRGYRRKTKGYVLASASSTAREIGDEPSQIKRKYPSVTVAVDGHRRRGMRRLLALPEAERPQVVVLDDAFQHRYVRPSLSILVTDSHRLFTRDRLLPVGTLREPRSGVRRADMVVVTKCDPAMKPIESRIIEDELRIDTSRPRFFTSIAYRRLEGVLGIGSGVLKVIAMDGIMKVPFKVSTTTSNFMMGVTACASAVVYVQRGIILPSVAFPTLIGVLLGALTGARLLQSMNVKRLRQIFFFAILLVALNMLYNGFAGRF